jgi:hypothetical protein
MIIIKYFCNELRFVVNIYLSSVYLNREHSHFLKIFIHKKFMILLGEIVINII